MVAESSHPDKTFRGNIHMSPFRDQFLRFYQSSHAKMQKPGPTAVQAQPSSTLPKVTLSPAPQKATSGCDVDHDEDRHKHDGEAVLF